MPIYISLLSLLTLIFILAYLIWRNEWLVRMWNSSQKETAAAEVEVARKQGQIDTMLAVRQIENRVHEQEKAVLRQQLDQAKLNPSSNPKQLPGSQNSGEMDDLLRETIAWIAKLWRDG